MWNNPILAFLKEPLWENYEKTLQLDEVAYQKAVKQVEYLALRPLVKYGFGMGILGVPILGALGGPMLIMGWLVLVLGCHLGGDFGGFLPFLTRLHINRDSDTAVNFRLACNRPTDKDLVSYALTHMKSVFPALQQINIKRELTRWDVVMLELYRKYPSALLESAVKKNKRLPPTLERFIAGQSQFAVPYAQKVIKGAFPEAEAAIAKSKQDSNTYLRNLTTQEPTALDAAVRHILYHVPQHTLEFKITAEHLLNPDWIYDLNATVWLFNGKILYSISSQNDLLVMLTELEDLGAHTFCAKLKERFDQVAAVATTTVPML